MNESIYIRQIKFIYRIIFIALVIMCLISLFLVTRLGVVWDVSYLDIEIFKTVIVILALLGIPAVYKFHKNWITHLSANLLLEEKLKKYRNSFFIMITTLEALSIIALTGYLFSADAVFLLIFGLFFVAFIINAPSESHIMRDLELNKESNQDSDQF